MYIERDLAIIGSGIAAICVISLAIEHRITYIAIDPDPLEGGIVASLLSTPVPRPRVPVLLNREEINFLGINRYEHAYICSDLKIQILKRGDYETKIKAYTKTEIQKPWFIRWIHESYLCFIPNIVNIIKNTLNVRVSRIHVISNIRRIDVDKRIIVTNTGNIIRYKRLVYTWPLDTLLNYLYTRNEILYHKLSNIIKQLNLKPIGIYLLNLFTPYIPKYEKLTITLHETKASRIHTVISIPLGNIVLHYLFTSFSENHPPLAGLSEKIYSEIRKHKLFDISLVQDEYPIVTRYGILNRVSSSLIKELSDSLFEQNIILFGRLALWNEISILSLVSKERKNLNSMIL